MLIHWPSRWGYRFLKTGTVLCSAISIYYFIVFVIWSGDKTPASEKLARDQSVLTLAKNLDQRREDPILVSNTLKKTNSIGVVNPHNFSYVLNNEKLCELNSRESNLSTVLILIFVQSSAEKPKPRQLIRETWSSVSGHKRFVIRTAFMIGQPTTSSHQDDITAESAQYKDMIQEDFVDHYRNLSLKHTMAMKWVSTFCDNANFIVKADDDTFVNVYQLFKFLDQKYPEGTASSLLYCSVYVNIGPRRYKSDKWYVSPEEYPNDVYPPYCEGFAYIMSADLAPKLYNISLYTKYYWIDDVYITGILAKKLGIQHQRFRRPFSYELSRSGVKKRGEDLLFILFKQPWTRNDSQWRELWKSIEDVLEKDLSN